MVERTWDTLVDEWLKCSEGHEELGAAGEEGSAERAFRELEREAETETRAGAAGVEASARACGEDCCRWCPVVEERPPEMGADEEVDAPTGAEGGPEETGGRQLDSVTSGGAAERGAGDSVLPLPLPLPLPPLLPLPQPLPLLLLLLPSNPGPTMCLSSMRPGGMGGRRGEFACGARGSCWTPREGDTGEAEEK